MMFEQSMLENVRTDKSWTVVVSFLGQVLAVALLILIPLIYIEALPRAVLNSILTAPLPPPSPPPPPKSEAPAIPKPPVKIFCSTCAPRRIPHAVRDDIVDEAPPAVNRVVSGTAPPIIGDMFVAIPTGIAPPPPPIKEPPKIVVPRRVRKGGDVQQANLIKKVVPTYPQLAKTAHVQGMIRFTAVIGRDGTIQNLQLVSGNPMLVEAARQAVSQWQYRPTLLNGEPVEVVTTIDVNFALSQ